VPRVAEPPAVPFTAQVTAVLELPETVAVNWNESPARMLALVGKTATEMEAGVDGCAGLFEVDEAAPPPQPPKSSKDASVARALASGRMAVRHTSNGCWLGVLSDGLGARGYWTKGKKKGNDQAGEIVECRRRRSV